MHRSTRRKVVVYEDRHDTCTSIIPMEYLPLIIYAVVFFIGPVVIGALGFWRHRRARVQSRRADCGEHWFIEVKMWRLMGDNGKPNDNILMHVLSPYVQHRSALTDCEKLSNSGFTGRKAINLELLNRMLVQHQRLRWEAGLDVPIGSGMAPASADGDPRAQGVELIGRFIQELSTQQFLELMHNAYAREYERHKDEPRCETQPQYHSRRGSRDSRRT